MRILSGDTIMLRLPTEILTGERASTNFTFLNGSTITLWLLTIYAYH
jgi:hypothetical protein